MATEHKPVIVDDYNHGKHGIDVTDQMVKRFMWEVSTRRWPLAVFIWLLNICAFNSYVIFKIQHQKKLKQEGKSLKVSDEYFHKKYMNDLALKVRQKNLFYLIF